MRPLKLMSTCSTILLGVPTSREGETASAKAIPKTLESQDWNTIAVSGKGIQSRARLKSGSRADLGILSKKMARPQGRGR